jgi:hypothetical protein
MDEAGTAFIFSAPSMAQLRFPKNVAAELF